MCVVFDQRSGDTHLLSILAGQILVHLGDVNTPDALTSRVASALGVPADANLREQVGQTLHQLGESRLLVAQ